MSSFQFGCDKRKPAKGSPSETIRETNGRYNMFSSSFQHLRDAREARSDRVREIKIFLLSVITLVSFI